MEQKRRQLPNGPRPFPLLGNFPQLLLGQKWEVMFADWKQQFGALYTFWYGPLPAVSFKVHFYSLIRSFLGGCYRLRRSN